MRAAELGYSLDGKDGKDRALHYFFWHACYLAGHVSVSASAMNSYRKESEYQASKLRAAAELLDTVRLSALWFILAENGFPFDVTDTDAIQAEHSANIKRAAYFWESFAAAISRGLANGHPLIIERSHGNEPARAYVGMLERETRKIFKSSLYGTLATVASVALSQKVTKDQVVFWCRGNKGA
jgi:hypothetical protein